MKHLVFEVPKYDLIKMAESEIMKVKMYIVSEGNNAHNMPISWEAIQEAKNTLVGKPIVAKYNRWEKDLEGHEKDEVPIGVILKEENLFEEVIDGKRWLGAYGDIWMRYSEDISGVLIRDMVKNLSMEILVAEESEMGDILSFAFTGITLIGSNKNPAVSNAKIEVLTFEAVKDEIEKRIFTETEKIDLSDSAIEKLADTIYKKFQDKEEGDTMEKNFEKEAEVKEERMACENEKMEEEVAEAEVEEEKMTEEVKEEQMTSDAYAENSAIEANQEKVAEEQKEIAEEQNEPEMMEIEKSKYEYYVQLEEDFADMKVNMESMKEDKDAFMTEFERLKNFEIEYNGAKFNAEVEATFAEIEDMPIEEINKFRETAKSFTLENIDDWKNQVFAKAYTYSKGTGSNSDYIKVGIINEIEKQKSNSLWD